MIYGKKPRGGKEERHVKDKTLTEYSNAPDVDVSKIPKAVITDTSSPQYRYVGRWGWSDYDGFMRCDGEKDLGIESDYYLIALGSYYGTEIGTKYRITTDTGNIFYGVLADQKDDSDTDGMHRYSYNDDVIEFLVDTRRLDKTVKLFGSANVYMPLNGKIANVERIGFE